MNPKAIEDAMKKDAAEAEAAVESDGEPAVVASPDAVLRPIRPMKRRRRLTPEMLRFTIRNEIRHGPVLGLSGLGIARVKTHLVLSDETQKKIVEIFGPEEPVEISTRVGFTGRWHHHVSRRKAARSSRTASRRFPGKPSSSRSAIRVMPTNTTSMASGRRSRSTSHEEKTQFVMTDMTLDGDGKRIRGDLYDTDFNFGIDKLGILGGDGERIEVENLHYILETDAKDEFLEFGAKMGSGEVKSKQLSAIGIELKEIHYDFSMRRLHTETLEKMLAGMKRRTRSRSRARWS